jgi:transcriptional regulator with XRE-family HTH domain
MDTGVSPEQIRAARALLGWSRERLAGTAGISPNSVARVETGKPCRASTLAAIQTALEYAGVEFARDGTGGVRLRHRTI